MFQVYLHFGAGNLVNKFLWNYCITMRPWGSFLYPTIMYVECRPKLLPVTVCNLVYWVVAKRMWNYGIPIKEKLKFTLILTFLECWRSVNFKRTFWCHRLNQKTNEICLRISALASKKRSDQKNKCTFLYHWLGAIQRWILQVDIFPHPFIC